MATRNNDPFWQRRISPNQDDLHLGPFLHLYFSNDSLPHLFKLPPDDRYDKYADNCIHATIDDDQLIVWRSAAAIMMAWLAAAMALVSASLNLIVRS